LGIAVRNDQNKLELLNGNQTMIAMTNFILSKGGYTIHENPFIGSTIVSTPMMLELAKYYNIECKLGLTGFKWIAKMIEDFPNQRCLGGGEESFGYMVGDFVRDKDAVTATLLACEAVTQAKSAQTSFFNQLLETYQKVGFYQERLVSLVKKGKSGAEEIEEMLAKFRSNPPTELDGSKVITIEDYTTAIRSWPATQEKESIPLPKANVLIFTTEDGSRVAARPSGTEPKVKFYVSVNGKLESRDRYRSTKEVLEQKIDRILAELGV
jgi:phosphoglucomutase